MSIRAKSLLIISAFLLILLATLYLAVMGIFQRGFQALERDRLHQDLSRVHRVLAESQQSLDKLVQEVAGWETTQAFLRHQQDRDPASTEAPISEANFPPDLAGLYLNHRLNLIAFASYNQADSAPKLVFGGEFDFNTQEMRDLPELQRQLLTQQIRQSLPDLSTSGQIPDHATSSPDETTEADVGAGQRSTPENAAVTATSKPGAIGPRLLRLPAGPMIFATQPVPTGQADVTVLILGRYLDAEMEEVARFTGLQIQLADWEEKTRAGQDGGPLPDFTKAQAAFSGNAGRSGAISGGVLSAGDFSSYILPLSSQILAGYAYLADLDGQPVWLLKIESPRELTKKGQASGRILLIAMSAIGLCCVLLAWLVLDKTFLAPMAKLNNAIAAAIRGAYGGSLNKASDTDLGAGLRSAPGKGDEVASFQMAGSIDRLLAETLEQQTNELNKRMMQLNTVAEIAHLATSSGGNPWVDPASGLKDLLKATANLIVERFGYSNASIFLLDEARQFAMLAETTAQGNNLFKINTLKIPVGSHTMVGWVTANNRPRVAAEVSRDPYYLKDEFLPDTRSEAVLPIRVRTRMDYGRSITESGSGGSGELILGALDIQSRNPNAFPSEDLTILHILANQLASAIYHTRLLEASRFTLEEASLLYQASRNIAQAENADGIFRALDEALKGTSYITAVYSVYPAGSRPGGPRPMGLRKITRTSTGAALRGEASNAGSSSGPGSQDVAPERFEAKAQTSSGTSEPGIDPFPERLPVSYQEIEALFEGFTSLLLDPANMPSLPVPLLNYLRQWECASAALLPVLCDGQLVAMFLLGSRQKDAFTSASLQPFASLAEMTAIAYQKVGARQQMEKSLTELRVLNAASQAIAVQTDLNAIFREIHQAVISLVGEVDFLIALYHPEKELIQIPYMWEGDGFINVEPFPLGQGLTSILIRSRQPLMIVENAEQQARALGAKILGKPAKSWLGVPLIAGGEVIGAIIVQDDEHEQRFNTEDQRLLTTLAVQVAATIRNSQILEITRLQAQREQLLHQVTSKIRSSVDIQTILATAATELGKALGAHRAHIQVGIMAQDETNTESQAHIQAGIANPGDSQTEPDFEDSENPGEQGAHIY